MTGRALAGWLLAVTTLVVTAGLSSADDPKLPNVTAFDSLVVDTLRDVHNRGADLYNTNREFEGTYRMYEGCLVTVRPLLAHRPKAQKLIDEGLAAASKEATVARQAFKLHETIEAVRKHLKEVGGTPAKKDPVAPMPKKKDPKKKDPTPKKPKDPMPKKKDPTPKKKDPTPKATNGGQLTGKVTFQGQPLAKAELTFVSLDQAKPTVVVATVNDEGTYELKNAIPAGKYVVTVTAKRGGKDILPPKYGLTTTSELRVEVKDGQNELDFELK